MYTVEREIGMIYPTYLVRDTETGALLHKWGANHWTFNRTSAQEFASISEAEKALHEIPREDGTKVEKMEQAADRFIDQAGRFFGKVIDEAEPVVWASIVIAGILSAAVNIARLFMGR
jgi:hypothetical protein